MEETKRWIVTFITFSLEQVDINHGQAYSSVLFLFFLSLSLLRSSQPSPFLSSSVLVVISPPPLSLSFIMILSHSCLKFPLGPQIVGKGARKKGRMKHTNGSFSDTSSNSLLRQVRCMMGKALATPQTACQKNTVGELRLASHCLVTVAKGLWQIMGSTRFVELYMYKCKLLIEHGEQWIYHLKHIVVRIHIQQQFLHLCLVFCVYFHYYLFGSLLNSFSVSFTHFFVIFFLQSYLRLFGISCQHTEFAFTGMCDLHLLSFAHVLFVYKDKSLIKYVLRFDQKVWEFMSLLCYI